MNPYRAIRLNLWLPVLILCAFLAIIVVTSTWEYKQHIDQLELRTNERVQNRMETLQRRIESLLRLQEHGLVKEEIAATGALPDVTFLALIANDGVVLYASQLPWQGKPAADRVPDFDSKRFTKAQQSRRLQLQYDAVKQRHLIAYQPISLTLSQDQLRSTRVGVLVMKYDMAPALADILDETLKETVRNIIIGGLTMLLLMFILHHWLTLPLDYLCRAVLRISQGDFSSPVNLIGHGELAKLGAAINKMQADLDASTRQLKSSYDELRLSEENLSVTLNSIGDAVITTNVTGNVTQLNPVAQQLTGWTQAEARGQPLAVVFHTINSQNRQPATNPVLKVLASGEIVGLANHTSLIARDGMEYQIADSAAPIRNKTGEIIGVVVVFHDVSKQYRQQARIAASEAELRKITDILPGPVSRHDTDGRYIFVSNVYQTWFGKQPDDVLGKTQAAVHGPELHALYQPYIKQVYTGETASFNMLLPNTAGTVRHVLMHLVPDFNERGKVCGYFTVGVDITSLKFAEQESQRLREQLIQSTKMESVGHLTAGIAHDFNNMLGAMLGYTELTQQVLADGKPQTATPYLAAILKAGDRAKVLIAQMLTFSRKSTRAGEDVPVIMLAPIVKEVANLLRSSIPSTIDLNYQIETENLKASIHPVHLHQIIVNLGINARDAIDEFGKIDIILARYTSQETLCASCKHAFQGDYAQLIIRDSGSGIEPDIQDKIFDPFFTTKAVGQGTGMGLSVVHGLVHSVGGHILLESNAEGSSISILLPLDNSLLSVEPGPAYNLPKSPTLLTSKHIMVVDDEPDMATMLRELLSMHGAQVTLFNSPGDALNHFKENPQTIDLVITDETMPGLSGMRLAKHMLAIKPDLPIILYTGYSENANAETAAAVGIAAFFYKPVKMNDLLQKIQQLLRML